MIYWLKKKIKTLDPIIDGVYSYRAGQGDSQAYGKLYLKYLDSIYRYIFFRVNQDESVAEDLTEQVFYKAWDYLGKGHKIDNFRAFVYRVAHNSVVDYYKEKGRLKRFDQEGLITEELIEEKALDLIRKEALPDAWQHLRKEQQDVLMFRFVEELSHKEIGKIIGKKEEAVRAIQYRGLRRLRQLLK